MALHESQRVSNLRPNSQRSLDSTTGALDPLRPAHHRHSRALSVSALVSPSGQRLVFFLACRNCPITHTDMELRTASEVSMVIFPSTVGLGWYSERVIQTR